MNPGDDEAQKCRAGDERERHVHGGGAGRDGHYDRRRRNQSTEQAHPSAEEDTAEMKGHQGRADAHERREEPRGKLRRTRGVAEEREAGHHRPEHQRRLLDEDLAVEHRHDPIRPALKHLPGAGCIQRLVHVPERGRAEIGEKNHPGRRHDPKLVLQALPHSHTLDHQAASANTILARERVRRYHAQFYLEPFPALRQFASCFRPARLAGNCCCR